jgi:hypothetical protein
MGKWGGGYMNAVMNGCRVAWLCGSRYGTPGKAHQLQIQNPKERCTTALIKIQDPMNLPPHSPISPSPHHSIIPVVSAANLSSLYRNFHFATGCRTRLHPGANENRHKRTAQHRGSARRAVSSFLSCIFFFIMI